MKCECWSLEFIQCFYSISRCLQDLVLCKARYSIWGGGGGLFSFPCKSYLNSFTTKMYPHTGMYWGYEPPLHLKKCGDRVLYCTKLLELLPLVRSVSFSFFLCLCEVLKDTFGIFPLGRWSKGWGSGRVSLRPGYPRFYRILASAKTCLEPFRDNRGLRYFSWTYSTLPGSLLP